MINYINVNYSKSRAYPVEALLREKFPDYKGFLITLNEEQRSRDICTINVLYEHEGELVVFAPTELQLNGQILYYKNLNSHAKCTTKTPEIVFGQFNNAYSAVLHFTF